MSFEILADFFKDKTVFMTCVVLLFALSGCDFFSDGSTSQQIAFDFLIQEQFLRQSLDQHVAENNISSVSPQSCSGLCNFTLFFSC